MRLGSLITAMVTPFDENLKLDLDRAAALAVRLVESGSEALVVGGTTGESPTLEVEEKIALFKAVVDAVGSRVPVFAGTGGNSTAASIDLTKKAEDTGVSGFMLVTPYYNKPSQEGLYRHFEAVASTTSLPVMLYNVPGRTGVNMLPVTVVRLAQIPNIVALKEASGNLDQVGEVAAKAPPGFSVYSGDDSLALPAMAVGASGVVSVASHLVGREMREMFGAFGAGNTRRAAEIHLKLLPLFKTLFITSNPVPVKTALRMVGFDVGGVRPPLAPMDAKEEELLRRCLESLGLLDR